MLTALVTTALLSTTVQPVQQEGPRIDVVFVLDTTGSMSSLIQTAKEKIWSIASSMAQTNPAPHIRMGLVAYRDRGDAYVTIRSPLSADLDRGYETLMGFAADGGGDTPESVNQALHEGINAMDWRSGSDVYRVLFLVGDAPPHHYQDDVDYPISCSLAEEKGIAINTIQVGAIAGTLPVWQEIAKRGGGDFFKVDHDGNAFAVNTPFDKEIAELSAELDATRIYYGKDRDSADERQRLSDAINRGGSVEARARRALFNHSDAGRDNFYGKGELLFDLEQSNIELSSIAAKDLPDAMQKMTADEKLAFVATRTTERKKLQTNLAKLAQKRQHHIDQLIADNREEASSTFSQRVYDTVRKQARHKMRFEKADALY